MFPDRISVDSSRTWSCSAVVGSWIVKAIVFIQAHVGGFAPGIIAATHPFFGNDGS